MIKTNQNLEEKYIKDYIIRYQKEHNDKQQLLNDLVSYPITETASQEGNLHDIKHLKLNDKLMNSWLIEVKKEYYNMISREDVEDAVIDFLITNNVFDNADITKSANEIAFYVRKAFFGHVITYFREVLHFSENVITESLYDTNDEDSTDDAFNDKSYSLYEDSSFQDFIEIEYDESYKHYLDVIGGMDKVLTDRQMEVYTMSNIMPQRAVAKELGISEASVSRTLSQADKRLKKSYTNWKRSSIMSDATEVKTDDKIKRFLDQFEMITDVDVEGTFYYFTYTVNWLKNNYHDRDFETNYSHLQKNKINVGLSVVDVIFDYILKSQFQLINDVLDAHVRGLEVDKTFTSRQKDRFTKAVLQAFYKYLDEVEDSVQGFIDTAIDNLSTRNDLKMDRIKNNDYDRLIDVMTSSR